MVDEEGQVHACYARVGDQRALGVGGRGVRRVLTKGNARRGAVQEASFIMPSFFEDASSRATSDVGVFEGEGKELWCGSCEAGGVVYTEELKKT